MSWLDTIKPINAVLVKVEKSDGIKQTESGLFVAQEEKGQNFGVIVVGPHFLTNQEYEMFAKELIPGKVVFFNSKLTYPVINISSKDVYMLIGLENIYAVAG